MSIRALVDESEAPPSAGDDDDDDGDLVLNKERKHSTNSSPSRLAKSVVVVYATAVRLRVMRDHNIIHCILKMN